LKVTPFSAKNSEKFRGMKLYEKLEKRMRITHNYYFTKLYGEITDFFAQNLGKKNKFYSHFIQLLQFLHLKKVNAKVEY
jgi:hypothetical protein